MPLCTKPVSFKSLQRPCGKLSAEGVLGSNGEAPLISLAWGELHLGKGSPQSSSRKGLPQDIKTEHHGQPESALIPKLRQRLYILGHFSRKVETPYHGRSNTATVRKETVEKSPSI